LPGGHSEWEPPDPFSNSEVKTLCADASVDFVDVKVGHCQALNLMNRNPHRPTKLVRVFFGPRPMATPGSSPPAAPNEKLERLKKAQMRSARPCKPFQAPWPEYHRSAPSRCSAPPINQVWTRRCRITLPPPAQTLPRPARNIGTLRYRHENLASTGKRRHGRGHRST
jgi:hypothetical protein